MNKKMTLILILTAFIASFMTSTATAQDKELLDKKIEFRKLILERNKLDKELQSLDKQAAEALKAGKSIIKINSKQETVQDKLELLTSKLENMAIRYDFELPPVPSETDQENKSSGSPAKKVEFERGLNRTLAEVKKQTMQFLAAINYDSITQATLKE